MRRIRRFLQLNFSLIDGALTGEKFPPFQNTEISALNFGLSSRKFGFGNGLFFFLLQILWTALSVALGLELRGEYIRGVPCIKKNQQLYCPKAGNSYPL